VNEMDEVVAEFLVESYENLDQFDSDLLALEHDPTDLTRIGSIFRTIHTVKGTCGFLGFAQLEHVTHVGENLLARLRDGDLALTPDLASALLALSDRVRSMLGDIEATGAEGQHDTDELIALFHDLDDRAIPAGSEAPLPAGAPPSTARPTPAAAAVVPAAGDGPRSPVADTTIRVDVEVLDTLMDLVGELVLTRNRFTRLAGADSELHEPTQQLSSLTTELQRAVTRTRMQPVGTVWSRVPRLVRDLAAMGSKQIDVETEGDETELDKKVVDAVKDPLTHMVRNAVDHGIETPGIRVASGKPAQGRIVLRAWQEAEQVVIEITDDGAGIDPVAIGRKAVEKGIVSSAQLDGMSHAEILQLVFAPGFSTAASITNVSGRGVGMDVVRTNIEEIGGTVDIDSEVGVGSRFTLRIPLTLAIVPVLCLRCDGGSYSLPLSAVREVVRISSDERARLLPKLHGVTVLRLEDRLVPVVDLRHVFGVESKRSRWTTLVILDADEKEMAVVVDRVNDTAEIVVKPLGPHFASVDVLAGLTILGDGTVSLVLDVAGLTRRAHRIDVANEPTTVPIAANGPAPTSLLLCETPVGARLAIELDDVERVVEVAPGAIEPVANGEAMQYDGEIIPVVRATEMLGVDGPTDGPVQVVVHRSDRRLIGVVLGQVVDVAEVVLDLDPPRCIGVAGTFVLDGRVTDVVDVHGLVSLSLALSGIGV
jgi:two-component system, chemotaxis family, sensor kinase CheA